MLWTAGQSPDSHLDEIWLDGQREPLALTANARLGSITRYVTDSDGNILHTCGVPVTETLYGAVEIRCVNRCPYQHNLD